MDLELQEYFEEIIKRGGNNLTANQIAYWNYVEQTRHNRETESNARTSNDINWFNAYETRRNNNLVNDRAIFYNNAYASHNAAMEVETNRHNVRTEQNDRYRTDANYRLGMNQANISAATSRYAAQLGYQGRLASARIAAEASKQVARTNAEASKYASRVNSQTNIATTKYNAQEKWKQQSRDLLFTSSQGTLNRMSNESQNRERIKGADTNNRRDNSTREKTALFNGGTSILKPFVTAR